MPRISIYNISILIGGYTVSTSFEVAPAVTLIAHTVLLMFVMVGFRIAIRNKDE